MSDTHLTGLEASNPLGFFAALGAQIACEQSNVPSRLRWSTGAVPYAVLDGGTSVESIAAAALEAFARYRSSAAIETGMQPHGDVKFGDDNLRLYLSKCRNHKPAASLASSLVAEGSYDNKREAKPSDLYFTAGQQRFLRMASEILDAVTFDDLAIGLTGPWPYKSSIKSLMWDVSDDRLYALSSTNPAKDSKLTNPGPEALAILGFSQFPVFGSLGRTLTLGASDSWKRGTFTWPVWTKPATSRAVASLLAQASARDKELERRSTSFRSWGISLVLQSAIRRSSQGGYGTFAPPEVIWQRD